VGGPCEIADVNYFAIILTILLGFCGLAVDIGRIELRTNQQQAAADAGALAGAGELMHSSNTNNAGSAAYNDVEQLASANGFPVPTFGTTAMRRHDTGGPLTRRGYLDHLPIASGG
jgi:Flp pilus assembly protein TadG